MQQWIHRRWIDLSKYIIMSFHQWLYNALYLDINECEDSPCSSDGLCSDTNGSFICSCQSGFSGNGFSCQSTLTSHPLSYDYLWFFFQILMNVNLTLVTVILDVRTPTVHLSALAMMASVEMDYFAKV